MLLLYWLAKVVSSYMLRVFSGELYNQYAIVQSCERSLFKFLNLDENSQNWKQYLTSLVFLNISLAVFSFIVLVLQNQFAGQARLPVSMLFNILISYTTGTNWQLFNGGDDVSTLVYTIITMLNFSSAAIGIAIAVAVVRAIACNTRYPDDRSFGNFYLDYFRALFLILIPGAIILGSILILLQVPQTFVNNFSYQNLEAINSVLYTGPIAAFEAIKILGVNGGGFFLTNSAHPFENPNIYTNYLHIIGMVLLPFALLFYYAKSIRRQKHGEMLFFYIWLMLSASALSLAYFEMTASGLPNFAGKELRFPFEDTILYTSIAANSSGAAVSDYTMYTTNGVMIILFKLITGSTLIGGLGTGLLNLILCVLLAVFFTGIMSGRTPEFIGKKVNALAIKLIAYYYLVSQGVILVFIAISLYYFADTIAATSKGLIDFFFLYTSTFFNNGSGYGEFYKNSTWVNLSTSFIMLFGRFFITIIMFVIANELSKTKARERSLDKTDIHTPFFMFIITFVILNNILPFVPLFVLSPISSIVAG